MFDADVTTARSGDLREEVRSLHRAANSYTRVQLPHDGIESRQVMAVMGSRLPWRIVERGMARADGCEPMQRMLYFRSCRGMRRYLYERLRWRQADDRFLEERTYCNNESLDAHELPPRGYLAAALAKARVELRETMCKTLPVRTSYLKGPYSSGRR